VKRLPAGTWTTEDTDIWVRVLERHGLYWYASNLIWFQEQDRRDAELMLQAQEVAQFGPAAIELYGIACRGWNSTPYWIEETADGEGIWQR
jgi:hypothetical protein